MRSRPRWATAHLRPRPFLTKFILDEVLKVFIKNQYQIFNDLLKKHSLPHIRFHELRHSCASMLIAMGWSLKDVQEWLGHSDVKMTANIYAHLDTTRKNNIAESLAEKFGA